MGLRGWGLSSAPGVRRAMGERRAAPTPGHTRSAPGWERGPRNAFPDPYLIKDLKAVNVLPHLLKAPQHHCPDVQGTTHIGLTASPGSFTPYPTCIAHPPVGLHPSAF